LYDDSRNSINFGCLLAEINSVPVNKIVIVMEFALLFTPPLRVSSQEIDNQRNVRFMREVLTVAVDNML
jgi:hypothetical protein